MANRGNDSKPNGPSSEPAADSSQSETLHRRVSAIAGHLRMRRVKSILARLSNEVEVLWEREGRRKPGLLCPWGTLGPSRISLLEIALAALFDLR